MDPDGAILAQSAHAANDPMYAIHSAQARRRAQEQLHANRLAGRPGGQADETKERGRADKRTERNDGKQPRRAVMAAGVVTRAFGAVAAADMIVMTDIAGKIVRNVVPNVQTVISPQANERQHELANEHGAADYGANQKQPG
jgi:hypothetical protein